LVEVVRINTTHQVDGGGLVDAGPTLFRGAVAGLDGWLRALDFRLSRHDGISSLGC